MDVIENAFLNYVLPILIAYLIAAIGYRVIRRLSGRIFQINDLAPERMRLRQERKRTLEGLFVSAFGFLLLVIATVFSLGLFIDTATLIWIIGLFSAAFGIGANRLIGDFLTGITFAFEDTLDVGDKVEVLGVEGVVEKINLRTLNLRATTGELYAIPNGEIRLIRNFSRGRFSTTSVVLKVPEQNLDEAVTLLEELAIEAVERLPNLLEPWHIINETGIIGESAELKLSVKARFGKAAELRPRLLSLVGDHLRKADIKLLD